MNIKEIYNKEKNNFLFSESGKFIELRKKLIEEIDTSIKNKKNNESIQYIDPKSLVFNYKYNDASNNINFIYEKNDDTNINVVDGKILKIGINDHNKKKITVKNIDSNNDFILNQFLDYQNYFNEDYILNLNSIFLNSGYEIIISENQEVTLIISNSISEDLLTIFQKNFIKCLENSKVTIIEECFSDKPSNYNLVNFFDIYTGAEVKHFILQKNKKKANLQYTSYANCNTKSRYKQVTVNISQASIRNHHYANIIGKDSHAELDGIFLASGDQIIDNKTQINHNFPDANSTQCYKGILTDKARASYLSKTFVDKIAQKTEAYQLSKGILLSEDSTFHSKPELKIFADDVKCSHGSTIGPIDPELLFYLRSRGLDKRESLSLLIKSFFHSIVETIDKKNFRDKFNFHSNNWLAKNNI